jgi:tRNA-splicing ligase RtcB
MEQITKKLLNWASILDENTREQAIRTSEMPFIYPHLALMPDAHLGKGATVGSVIPTLGAIMPAAVGVDIGCGMIAVRTQLTTDQLPADRRPVREHIERLVPVSAGGYNRTIDDAAESRIWQLEELAADTAVHPIDYAPNWRLQLGSLGSGNHFIEITRDEEDRVWLFLHSGSRGVGNKIAVHHIGVAEEYCRRHWIDLPDRDLAYLVEGTDQFDTYIRELRWAQRFALLNREVMMDRVGTAFAEWVGEDIVIEQRINCHHNYTEQAQVYGRDVWLSRKGAINAEAGQPGLIPGSMGTASYVVRGNGYSPSLNSSPHGAGREYSRSKARRTFTREQLDEAMAGIEWRHTDAFLDEIPQAYKPIDQVMADAAELVTIEHTLNQLVNVKGD